MWISRMITTTVMPVFAIRNTNPKPTKRRSVDRSVVRRDSSWPDGHRSWKATGSRCTCANRSRRMSVSRPIAALDIAIRRR